MMENLLLNCFLSLIGFIIDGRKRYTRGSGIVCPRENKKEKDGKKMNLKFVIPNMKETFGNLTFAGESEVRMVRGRTISRSYNLYSDVQTADDIVVTLPSTAGAKSFKYEQPVILKNPRITAEGKNADGNGYTSYVLTADDMAAADK